MKILIVILNYNGYHLLKKHLPSVTGTDYPDYDILVVDNASDDDSIGFLQERYPDVLVHRNSANLGFGRANNVAFNSYTGYDAYALLNNDMRVNPGWLKDMVSVLESDVNVGAVGPKILYAKKEDGAYRINSAGGVIDKFDRGFDRYEGCPDAKSYEKVDEVDFVSGGAMLIRKSVLRDVGGFDERMFFYYEDVDICLRMRDRGWKCVYTGKTTVYHDHMGTVGSWSSFRVTRMANMNRIRSIARRKGVIQASVEFIRSPLEWIVYTLYGKITKKSYRDRIIGGMSKCIE